MKRVIKSGTINSSDNILDMAEDKVTSLFIDTMKDYVDEFYSKVTTRCKIPGRGIIARFDTDKYGDFYMDYSCLYNTYSKEDAKLALEIFKKYANIVSMYLDTLKFKYTDIEYEVTKTIVSSARIGKGLYVYNFPFSLPDKYYEGGKVISSTAVKSSTSKVISSTSSTNRKAVDIVWDVEVGEDVDDEEEQEEVLNQLPTEIDIPDDIEDEEIADYISDEYGWLVEDFSIV